MYTYGLQVQVITLFYIIIDKKLTIYMSLVSQTHIIIKVDYI